MIRLLVFLGLLSGGVFFVFLGEDESKPVMPIAESEPESQPLVVKQKITISDIPSEEPVDEWIASEDMLEPVLIKPPVIALADSDDFIHAALVSVFPDSKAGHLFSQILPKAISFLNTDYF